MSLARTSLIKLYDAITNLKKEFWWSPKKKLDSALKKWQKEDAITNLKKEFWWSPKKKLDSALKKWQKEDRERYTQLIETMRTLDNMEEKY
jgi:septal ring factor EnvC (AmiA/AmiB activator)